MTRALTKLTVNLVDNATDALTKAHEITGDTRTDCVNRALQVYAAIVAATRAYAPTQMTFDEKDGPVTLVVYPARSRSRFFAKWRLMRGDRG